MKKLLYIIIIAFSIASTSCDPRVPVSTFDAPFPKRNFDLTLILGNQISIIRFSDTLTLNISSDNDKNTISYHDTGDTIFSGKVCKYRGLYYFNLKYCDSVYWIYAVKIEDNLIYGFDMAWSQTLYVDSAIRSDKYKKLVKFRSSDDSIIILHPEKREMKKLFGSIINEYSPDTIINRNAVSSEIVESNSVITEFDLEEFNLIRKVYPNPASDIVNIELQKNSKSIFKLTDLNGKTVREGPLNGKTNKIDISKQQAGLYAITVFNLADKQKETIKIVKAE